MKTGCSRTWTNGPDLTALIARRKIDRHGTQERPGQRPSEPEEGPAENPSGASCSHCGAGLSGRPCGFG